MMLELEKTGEMNEEDRYLDIKVLRLADANGAFHFYRLFNVTFMPGTDGMDYFVTGRRYDDDDGYLYDFLGKYRTPEAAWKALESMRFKADSSCWRYDAKENCITDPEGIRFTLGGEALA